MTLYAPEAIAQIDALRSYYETKNRPTAARALDTALDVAEQQIALRPGDGLPAPRPYPELARPGQAWLKAGRYWIAYGTGGPPVILAVFFETADIPGRF